LVFDLHGVAKPIFDRIDASLQRVCPDAQNPKNI